MVETSRATLRHLLLAGYDDLKRRLTRRLGSAELAGEALQDAFLRLECAPNIGVVRSPQAYLFRMAFNLAINRQTAENRRLSPVALDALLGFADDSPGPARTAEARSEIEALKRALAELPARRREIFLASWVEEISHSEIARRFGVSLRTIQIELKYAVEHCALRLDRNMTKKFADRPRRLSVE
jgi:RNA polymerase sigma-70 factor, ECF subfamily